MGIQKLRYDVLRQAFVLSNKMRVVNLFKIGGYLGIENEKLHRIYYYLEDESLIDFFALGGCFLSLIKEKNSLKKGTLIEFFRSIKSQFRLYKDKINKSCRFAFVNRCVIILGNLVEISVNYQVVDSFNPKYSNFSVGTFLTNQSNGEQSL